MAGLFLARDSRAQRRFVCCLCAAVALHAAAVYSRRFHALRPVVEQPLRTVPVSLESSPAPPQATATGVVAPHPTPIVPATKAPLPVAAAPHGGLSRREAKPSRARTPDRPSSRPRDLARSDLAPHPHTKPAEDASAFGNDHGGAFRASVCFVPEGLESALLITDYPSIATFATSAIDVSPRRFRRGFPGVEQRTEWFGIDYRGHFKVGATGYYSFRLVSDDGAVLFIDGAIVVDNDGLHGARSVAMSMPLNQGDHEFRLLYYQGPGSRLALQLFVKSYQTPERLFGPEL